ncbi:2 iron, 2 sulfur cluster Hypothetical protein [Nesidiocoris tenuis]|uniref:FAD-binding PCMH-type domain-containing protein n=1 Tax=Nesidiocoris tenuis TaxID=355587 RepID=A0ABN7BDU3_9HEMI|nr:2 iron, 2 sulfur cluster Hypothetical protein [Nesidiocoris tenuis]
MTEVAPGVPCPLKVNYDSVTPQTSLLTFIRDRAMLKGTKYMCREGGCGSCVVAVQSTHPATQKDNYYAVNSCLVPVLSCHGAAIVTDEGIGSKQKGYHEIQKKLAVYNGTQCGYCSPGMVMNMYSLMKSDPNLTMAKIEDSFAGNICRCTGYRSILDAFKSMAKDAPKPPKFELTDIEDSFTKVCGLGNCSSSCPDCPNARKEKMIDDDGDEIDFIETAMAPKSLRLTVNGIENWIRVSSIQEIMEVLDMIGDNSYTYVAGNTATGVYRNPPPKKYYIDITGVAELRTYQYSDQGLTLGANLPLTETMNLFYELAKDHNLLYGYLEVIADHIDLVANVPVRNIGTIAGNLSIKYEHRDFVSDIFLLMETAGAMLTIVDPSGIVDRVTMLEYLHLDMQHKLITKIHLPPISSKHYVMKTYKILPRKQNVHAIVNAGFLFRVKNANNVVEEKPKIIFGGINDHFYHAYEAESYLTGKQLCNQSVLQGVMTTLLNELNPDANPLDASPEYRKNLAASLLYKAMLNICSNKVDQRLVSGGTNLVRPLSSGKQDYTYSGKYKPVGLPIEKLEAQIQTAGEAVYVNDIPPTFGELYGALVITKRACADLANVDASNALTLPGVVSFFSAEDIPGLNSFITIAPPLMVEPEEIFCSGKVQYAGQPVGMIVAITQELAIKAAEKVILKYANEKKPLLTIKEVLKSGNKTRVIPQAQIAPTKTPGPVEYKINGEIELGGQYHFTMELQSCLAVPTDNGIQVFPASQWMQLTQAAIARMLNVPDNYVEMEVKRIGGGFGCKISRASLVACACTLAAYHLNKPVRMVLSMETTMEALGKRCAAYATYEAGVDAKGVIQYLDVRLYDNKGVALNDAVSIFVNDGLENAYDASAFTSNFFAVKTDLPGSAWMRGPGTLEATTVIEFIMDHISHVTGVSQIDVRLANVNPSYKIALNEMVETLKKSADYTTRSKEIETFNKDNRWKKRALGFAMMRYEIIFLPAYYATVSIFPGDGSVVISAGGIEMGQGVNTKAAQVCAYTLGIPLSQVRVIASKAFVAPGSNPSGGSITSDSVCAAVQACCRELNVRLGPYKKDDLAWPLVVQAANAVGVNLVQTHATNPTDLLPKPYPVFGVSFTEVEVDILTGQYQIMRTDILEDAGESLNPLLDVGQIEGGYVMGCGYFSSEELKYDMNTGENLTHRTWTYWPPGAKDIPIDFRVTLRKNAPNPLGVLRSKATGEPPMCMACSLPLALRRAIDSARKDAGLDDDWIIYDPPCTFEKTFLAAGTNPKKFVI